MTREALEQFLLHALDELEREGRIGRGALLKKRVVERFPDFTEASFDAASFGDLLRSFPALQVISHPGTDVEVRRAGATRPATSGESREAFAGSDRGTPATIAVIDRDLWRAMTDPVDAGTLFDRVVRAVVADDGEKDPQRFVAVPRISAEEQAAIVREFIATLPDGPVRVSLESEAKLRPFTFAGLFRRLRDEGEVGDRWRHRRAAVIADRLAAWANEHEIDLTGLVRRVKDQPDRRQVALRPPTPELRAATATREDEAERLRGLIKEALPEMTLEELLAFHFPARFVLARALRDRRLARTWTRIVLFTLFADEATHTDAVPGDTYARVGVVARPSAAAGAAPCRASDLYTKLLDLDSRVRALGLSAKGELSGTRMIRRLTEARAANDKGAVSNIEAVINDLVDLVGTDVDIVVAYGNKKKEANVLSPLKIGPKTGPFRRPRVPVAVGAAFTVACHAWVRETSSRLKSEHDVALAAKNRSAGAGAQQPRLRPASFTEQVALSICFDHITTFPELKQALVHHGAAVADWLNDEHWVASVTYVPSEYDPLFQLADVYGSLLRWGLDGNDKTWLMRLRKRYETGWVGPNVRAEMWIDVTP